MKIMLFCKKTLFCDYAINILKSYYDDKNILVIRGDVGKKLDDELCWYNPEYIISFLSPWIIQKPLLKSARKAAINFHPGSLRYPGSGCYNFAIYERAIEYGVTCHHMEEHVDTGNIILTSNFLIAPNETVESLKLKSMNHLLFIFEKILHEIYANDWLPTSEEKWLCEPYTKKQLNELCRIDPTIMDANEVSLRVRATAYGDMRNGAYIEVANNRFFATSSAENPLV